MTNLRWSQTGTAHIPEYSYSSKVNEYTTLEKTVPGQFEFYGNIKALDKKGQTNLRRIHFTPLWYPDGEYVVKTYVYDCWTPAGMVGHTSDAPITINGNMYNDWYVNHGKK